MKKELKEFRMTQIKKQEKGCALYEITEDEVEILNILRRMENTDNDSIWECGEYIKKFLIAVNDAMDNFKNMNDDDYCDVSTLICNAGVGLYNSISEISEITEKNDDWNTAHRNENNI